MNATIAISPPAQGGYKQWLSVRVHNTNYGPAADTLLADTKPSFATGSWHVREEAGTIVLDGGMVGLFAKMVITPSSRTVTVSTRHSTTDAWSTQTFVAGAGDLFLVTL